MTSHLTQLLVICPGQVTHLTLVKVGVVDIGTLLTRPLLIRGGRGTSTTGRPRGENGRRGKLRWLRRGTNQMLDGDPTLLSLPEVCSFFVPLTYGFTESREVWLQGEGCGYMNREVWLHCTYM